MNAVIDGWRSRGGVSDTDFGTREFATLDLDGDLLTFFPWEED